MATTFLRAAPLVSSVPKDPSVGVATVQSPVSFGQAPLAGAPAAFTAARSSDAVPPIACSPDPPRMSPTAGPGGKWRGVTRGGDPGRDLPGRGVPAPGRARPP